jgi:hypothetical protein
MMAARIARSRHMRRAALVPLLLLVVATAGPARAADPPAPSGAHPRLFMSSANLAAFTAKAQTSGTGAAQLVAQCQDSITTPANYTARGGVDANTWPNEAMACAFAYVATQQAKYLTPALTYWKASLNDDQNIGDGLGCTAANSTFDWKTQWDGNYPPPPVLLTVSHDTGYPMRWYGPDIALTYDWLYNAPGVDDALRTQTQTCMTAWLDYYTAKGYLHDQAGFNYNAGFVIGKTLGAIALGSDGGADGHLWTETIHDVFATTLVAKGLAGSNGALGTAAGVLVGGDWGSWQYGPLSVGEYALATRAMEEAGVPQPDMDAWLNSVAVRTVYGILPKMDVQFVGNGDFDSDTIYEPLRVTQLNAALLGPATDAAAGWMLYIKQQQNLSEASFHNALAEIRNVTAADYRAQTPPPPLWYLARGTGTMSVRTSWGADAFWGVFMSGPFNADHQHLAASNFVFSRGGDHLIVDSSNYGEPATFETNAVSADTLQTGNYASTQTPWSKANLVWARGSDAAVFAARGDLKTAFDGIDSPSDIIYGHREWVMLPEGEIVTIDRMHTGAASHSVYVNFHTNTAGTLKIDATTGVASGTAGGSGLAIHPVLLSGGTPAIVKPPVGSCTVSCSFPCGSCTAARFAVDEYSLKLPGAWAVAIHAIDGLASGEQPAQVGSLNDDNFDPAPKQNGGVIGAAVYRSSKQSYVVASSAMDGVSPTTMTYGVPGGSAGRHIVYDAPEASDGTSSVSTAVQSGRCAVTITAGSGGGFTGHPLMFQVASAANNCAATQDTNVMPGSPPPGGGVNPQPPGGGSTGSGGASGQKGATGGTVTGGCGCAIARGASRASAGLLFVLALAVTRRRRR